MSDNLEALSRLERMANKPNWLDEPAILGGEPVILRDSLPFGVKIVISILGIVFSSMVVLAAVSEIYYRITGHVL